MSGRAVNLVLQVIMLFVAIYFAGYVWGEVRAERSCYVSHLTNGGPDHGG